MCGIAGYMVFEGQARAEVAERMAIALHHRGPDSAGVYEGGEVAFGFRRLSIIDLEGGDQPLYNEDRSVVLVCNGEIFNYREIRRELIGRGHRFTTDCDVEVILHLYEELGTGLLDRLNGQFAFALHDRRRNRLLLARDHFGINPLHYSEIDGQFLFASEIKGILQHPDVSPRIDLTGLDQVLSLPGLVSPRTMFEGVRSLRPGHYLTVEDGEVREREYWDLIYPRQDETPEERSDEEHVQEIREHFFRSVSYRLQADVPVGYYLSGGLDSSLIAAAIYSLRPESTRKSFSVAFENGQNLDRRNQQLMSRKVGSRHFEIPFDISSTADRLRDVIYHCECPIKETYNACTLALSESARAEGVPVVLTGEGADEMFAGYVGYRFDQFGTRRQDTDLEPWERALEEDMRLKVWGSRDIFYEHDLHGLEAWKRALYSQELSDRFHEFDFLNHELINPERVRDRHPIHWRSYLDFKLRLADHLLGDHGDRMALANSVEARHPFLDVDLVEYSTQLPPDLKLRDFTEKYVLREIARGLLPREIAEREKFGWFAPGSPELLQTGVEWVQDLLSTDQIRRQGYFNPDTVEHLKTRYSQPGFKLNMPYESDLLAVVLTFNLLLDLFDVPALA